MAVLGVTSCPHTSFRQGKRILIILKDGGRIVDKCMGNKSGCLIMQREGRVSLSKIRSASIYKG